MRYIILQGDGMGDEPQEELNGLTPLEAANTPNMDYVASQGNFGMVETIPPSMTPGSAVGNMSLLGLDPRKYYTGRASLEAKGMGINLSPNDIAFRCNLVSLGEDEKGNTIMKDYSGGHVRDEAAEEIVEMLNSSMDDSRFELFAGTSYRNIMVWHAGKKKIDLEDLNLTPPHNISGKKIAQYLPRGKGKSYLLNLMEMSQELMKKNGYEPNSIWFWGAGTKPDFPSLRERFNLEGFVITAVDLIRGLGSFCGLKPIEVEGATGFLDTNYSGKAQRALENLGENSLVFIHVEAPDEASHMGDLDAKMDAIENIDSKVLGPILEEMRGSELEKIRLLLATDHFTVLSSGAHERGSVPFAIFPPVIKGYSGNRFSETDAIDEGLSIEEGWKIMDLFVNEQEEVIDR